VRVFQPVHGYLLRRELLSWWFGVRRFRRESS
jgi:hypothetical protein